MPTREFDTTFDFDRPPTWEPLERLATVLGGHPAFPVIEPHMFMYMVCLLRQPGGAPLHLYKHIDRRTYINLDDEGHAYEYLGSGGDLDSRSGGRYRPHRSIADAIARLDLEALVIVGDDELDEEAW